MPDTLCPFCHIDPTRQKILKHGSRVSVMPSNPQLTPGHLLVIPVRHVTELSQLDADECRELFDTAIMFQEKIVKRDIGNGCDIRQHWRPFLPESAFKVDHVHMHLLPRKFNDPLYTEAQILEDGLFKHLTEDEMLTELAFLWEALGLS